jgi:hypothetical protein
MTVLFPTSEEIEQAAASASQRISHAYASAMRQLEQQHPDRNWKLLAQIFDFLFRPHNVVEPFAPMMVAEGKRSLMPADLTEEDLAALAAGFPALTDPELRSRIGDLLWLRRKDSAAARAAIEGYIASGRRMEELEHWTTSAERYERAIRLARQLGKKEPLLTTALTHIESRVRHYAGDDPRYFTLRALSLLHEFRFGDPAEQAGIAAVAAERANREKDFRRAREYWTLEAKSRHRANQAAAAKAAETASARTHISEAEGFEAANSFMAAHGSWNHAIQAFRRLPAEKHRVPELHRRLNAAGEKISGEMQAISTEFDITEAVKSSREAVRGRPFDEALFKFVLIEPLIDPSALRRDTEESIQQAPLHAMFTAQVFDAAGRKVDERPSIMTDDPEEREKAMQGLMDHNASLYRQMTVAGALEPALRQLLEEHSPDEADITRLIRDSSFIPEGRLKYFVRGVSSGLERDLVMALHLLIPQVENSLRLILQQQGVITTQLDVIGIEEAWPLGTILSEPKLADVLGAPLVYELRTLLLGKPGWNFRNLLAHGLLNPQALMSSMAFYLWWIILRLIVMPTSAFHGFAERSGTTKTQATQVGSPGAADEVQLP